LAGRVGAAAVADPDVAGGLQAEIASVTAATGATRNGQSERPGLLLLLLLLLPNRPDIASSSRTGK
jgi:hypothetical protein